MRTTRPITIEYRYIMIMFILISLVKPFPYRHFSSYAQRGTLSLSVYHWRRPSWVPVSVVEGKDNNAVRSGRDWINDNYINIKLLIRISLWILQYQLIHFDAKFSCRSWGVLRLPLRETAMESTYISQTIYFLSVKKMNINNRVITSKWENII